MEFTTEHPAKQLDREQALVELRAITRPRLDVPSLRGTLQRTETVSGILRSLLAEFEHDDREAMRVMHRLGTRLLTQAPPGEPTPYTAWQYLVNLARCTEALLTVDARSR
ncbi:hypothetical protein [Streptomyces sp. JB150]|uniref:hypothetical protein n=1 Tax=Streptomyces sp. JB150 TaxID=2714844 RepID=UPI00140A3AE4|nr:hypothetical protein [Streptomyces sp. JB150]QIJ62942.1 hypothetical protein G7Z13_13515 [Streptomyces sp. JB150]